MIISIILDHLLGPPFIPTFIVMIEGYKFKKKRNPHPALSPLGDRVAIGEMVEDVMLNLLRSP
jgi:hypothetical protein